MFDFHKEIIIFSDNNCLHCYKFSMWNSETKQARPFWLLISLAAIIIIFWIITICSPSIFWRFMDIILWFFLILAWTAAIINTFKNQNVKSISFLWIIGFLLVLIWFLLIFSRSQFVWTLMIWMFALWALIRWWLLIAFGIMNKENQPMRWAIAWLWCLLFILAIVIAASDKSEARTLAWICIWISTILDGISLLAFALKVKNNPSVQAELVNQANQNEIAQGDVIISQVTVDVIQPQSNENQK